MAEKRCKYYEWDEKGHTLPEELILSEDSSLADAIRVFYAAGGYDFFKVADPKLYADNWLEFVGEIYSSVMSGKYEDRGESYTIPITEKERKSLKRQKVPDIFIDDRN